MCRLFGFLLSTLICAGISVCGLSCGKPSTEKVGLDRARRILNPPPAREAADSKDAHDPGEPGWRKATSLEGGVSAFVQRKAGRRATFVYVPFGESGQKELEDIDARIMAEGYNLLTLEGTASAVITDSVVTEFVRYAALRPGISVRLLCIAGRRFPAALPPIIEASGRIDGLIVLRPGDAPLPDPAFLRALPQIPETLSMLWVTSGYLPESAVAGFLSQFVRLKPEGRIRWLALAAPESLKKLPKDLGGDTLTNFAAIVRNPPVWRKASDIFESGCTPDGIWKIYVGNYWTSSGREADFCPLFLKTPDGSLLRAVDMSALGCHYQLPGFKQVLRCKY